MTRYARSQGSKSCNSKLPSTSTPWHLLKKRSLRITDGECGSQDVSSRSDVEANDKKNSEVVACDGSWFNFCEKTSSSTCRKELKNKASKKKGKIDKPQVERSTNSGIQRTDEDLIDNGNHRKSTIHAALKNDELISNDKHSPKVPEGKSITSSLKSKNESTESKDESSVGNNMIGRLKPRVEDRDHLREIRRKEKAKKREKKKLCFCCRRWGHQLSDCPEFHPENTMEINIPAGGFCYRCGSTEHMVNQCNKPGNSSLKYARCFICGEEGHLARDCSDNPNGKYPKGGSCLICGSKNHLRVACPKYTENDSEAVSAISRLTSGPVEILVEDLQIHSPKMYSPTVKKIKF